MCICLTLTPLHKPMGGVMGWGLHLSVPVPVLSSNHKEKLNCYDHCFTQLHHSTKRFYKMIKLSTSNAPGIGCRSAPDARISYSISHSSISILIFFPYAVWLFYLLSEHLPNIFSVKKRVLNGDSDATFTLEVTHQHHDFVSDWSISEQTD